jgi:N-acetylmuramoyl-L-alanine amidase
MMQKLSRRRVLTLLTRAAPALAVLGLSPPLVFAQVAYELNIKGQDLLNQGKIEEAIKVLMKAAAEDVRNERTWNLLGRAYVAAEKPALALDAYRKALHLSPDDSLIRMMVDILSQEPLPRPKTTDAPKRVSELARAAADERKRVMSGEEPPLPGTKIKRRLVLDPGHGGLDAGCAGQSGLYEKNAALDIALRVARELYALCPDVEIFMTRTGDYPVPGYARSLCASLYNADLFVSVHASCSKDRKRSGFKAFTYAETPSSEGAGELALLENSVPDAGAAFPGKAEDMPGRLLSRRRLAESRAAGKKAAALFAAKSPVAVRLEAGPFDILRAIDRPAFLIEAGMLSNADDEAALSEEGRREELAKAVAAALCETLRGDAGTGRGAGNLARP